MESTSRSPDLASVRNELVAADRLPQPIDPASGTLPAADRYVMQRRIGLCPSRDPLLGANAPHNRHGPRGPAYSRGSVCLRSLLVGAVCVDAAQRLDHVGALSGGEQLAVEIHDQRVDLNSS